ncbi:MAG: GNAT family N-acetyltransferase, partial [Chloroflexota bacterium]
LKPWMDWAENIPDDIEYEAIMRQSRIEYLKREDLQLLITDKSTGIIIGSTGFHRIDWSIPKVEIGYWISKSHEGQGFVTETVRALETIAFDHLGAQRIEIRCDADNEKSAAIPRRLGYRHEATFQNFRRHHLTNELVAVLVFAKIP